jgi:hypothetical protein
MLSGTMDAAECFDKGSFNEYLSCLVGERALLLVAVALVVFQWVLLLLKIAW